MAASIFFLLLLLQQGMCLLPPKFQWKVIDYKWESNEARQKAIKSGDYIPENNMPTGVARWRDKLFITIPRWKDGNDCNISPCIMYFLSLKMIASY